MCAPTLPAPAVLRPLLESVEAEDFAPRRLPLALWGVLLERAEPVAHAERPLPEPADTDGRRARVRLLAARRAAGVGLFNDADRIRMPRPREGVGPPATPRPGRPRADGRRAAPRAKRTGSPRPAVGAMLASYAAGLREAGWGPEEILAAVRERWPTSPLFRSADPAAVLAEALRRREPAA